MDGYLFSAAEARVVKAPLSLLPACDRCGLFRGCRSAKMSVDGEGRRKIMIVGDYPGRDEDREGKPLVGKAGQELAKRLSRHGIDLRRDCWLTNALSCYAPDAKDHPTAVTDCRPKVMSAIRKLNPEVIVLAGGQAVKSVIGHLWKEKTGSIGRWVGWHIPAHKPNAWVCPIYNPAALLYDDADPVESVDFDRHLAAVADLRGRPWPDGPPEYEKRVEVIEDPDEAADRLDRMTGLVAYDFETTCAKPEGPGSQIVCCSVCRDGEETIAFPWLGAVKDAVREMLTDDRVQKIASNLDMEDRWTREHLGIEVVGWRWDTMLAAHALDPRGDGEFRKSNDGITGLKFQSFVRCGQPAYNDHIEPFLIPGEKGGYVLNRVKEIKRHLLLKYAGLDALLEYEVAVRQMRDLGIDP